ncbi:hypothetical protein O7630_05065 [Micromonospora sp. WMMD718]|uniref:hypothetical protein n=1 Tax=unclassified Micromonospora TaxID=2617518 RepID=UPI000A8DBE7D|nr:MULTISPECIES: hypothetical protein [unclassified Micromonospora]MDG4750299.1 hypothetical protein [Micromonospora sp. WMMD718]
MVERVTADRLILVNVVDRWFYLRQPTFIGTGQSYWIDHETSELCVDRGAAGLPGMLA